MKLNIVQKFTLLSAVATVLIVVGLGLLVSHIVTAGMLRDEGEITASTLRTVTGVDLNPEEFQIAAISPGGGVLGYIWQHLREIPDVYQMWAYDSAGRVVWTSRGYPSWDEREVKGDLAEALGGVPRVSFGLADELYEYRAGLVDGTAVLQIYVPLLEPVDGSVYCVLEVWKRPESFVASRRRLVVTIWVAGAAGGLVLFLFLHGFFRRALREQTRLRGVEERFGNVELEMEVAGQIQRKLMPAELPEVPGYSLAGWHETAREVGGDYYDAFVTRDRSLAVIVADSERKGMPGALVAARVRHLVRSQPEAEDGVVAVIRSVDRMLREESAAERTVSAFFARLEPHSGRLRYCGAGRCTALLARDGEVQQLATGEAPLGAHSGSRYVEGEVPLRPGDCLLLCTDGMTAACNAAGELYGLDGIRSSLLRRRQGAAAGEVLASIRQDFGEFAGGTALADDITVVCLAAGPPLETGGRNTQHEGVD